MPSPPHWAMRRPSGFRARARFPKRRSWSLIQWNVAVEKIRSTRSSEPRAITNPDAPPVPAAPRQTASSPPRPSPENRQQQAQTPRATSRARTPSPGQSHNQRLSQPRPHAASRRSRIPTPQLVCGAESFSYSDCVPLASQDHTSLVLSQNVRHNDRHMDSIEVISSGSKSGVGVLDKSVAILAFLSGHSPASLAEVVEGTRLPRPTAHRLLSALEDAPSRIAAGWTIRPWSEVARVGKQGCWGRSRGAGAAGAGGVAGREWGEHAALRAGGRAQGMRGRCGAGDGFEGHRTCWCCHAALAGVCGQDFARLGHQEGSMTGRMRRSSGGSGSGVGPRAWPRGRPGLRASARRYSGRTGGSGRR